MGSCVVVLPRSVADGCSPRQGLCCIRVAYGFSVWRQSLSAQVPASEKRKELEDGLTKQCMNTQCRHCKQAAFPANVAGLAAEAKISNVLWFADAQQAQEVCCSSRRLVAAHRGITMMSDGDPHNYEK